MATPIHKGLDVPLFFGTCEPLPEPSLEKALGPGEIDPAWVLRGFATTSALDADNQIIDQAGIDWSEYDNRPIIHFRHPYSAERVLGEGVLREVRIVNGVEGSYIEAVLNSELPLAKEVRDMHVALCKGPSGRGLGFSVEGSVVEMRGNVITKCRVRSIAVDAAPRNPTSFAAPLAAGMGGDMASLFPPEVLEKAMRLTYDSGFQERFELAKALSDMDATAVSILLKRPQATLEEVRKFLCDHNQGRKS